MFILQTAALFVLTALAEIIGCYCAYLWMRGGSPWLLPIGAAALAVFAFLLSLHPAASGRIYAAYGGIYVATALAWLKIVDGETISSRDWIGAGLSLLGMVVIVTKWR